MINRTLVSFLTLAVIAFSAPRGAAAFDFNGSSAPLELAAAPAAPAAPAPVTAAPKTCKPFLIALSVGGVSESVALERACTPENDPVWAIKVERNTKKELSVKVSSDKYPEEKAKIESRIKSMVVDGISQEDADFIVMKTGPALARAEGARPRDQVAILAEATKALKEHLARP